MKKICILLLVLLLLPFVFASENLSIYGFEGIELGAPELNACESFEFNFHEQGLIEEEGILSLRAEFTGKESDNSFISLNINGRKQNVWPEYFVCEDSCWARVFVPELSKEKTNIEICLFTGGATQNAKIFSDSTIGLYNSPLLTVENRAPEQILLGQRAEMKTIVANNGALDAEIFVQFVGPDRRAVMEISSFDIVEGEPSAKTIIEAGERREFTFYIKPTKASSFNLPSAILYFDNIFGETQSILSNHPQLVVLDPEQADILLISEGLNENIFNFKVKVVNNWPEPFEGVVQIFPMDLVEDANIEVSLPGKGEEEFSFSSQKLLPGKYSISASLSDGNNTFNTQSVSFEIRKEDFSFEIILSVFGIIIALAIFLGIYFWKD